MRKSPRSFRQQVRPLKGCTECSGRGTTSGLFYEMPCDHCHASGMVDKETGEPLSLEDLVLQLRIRLNQRSQDIRELQRQLTRAREEERGRGHGPMGMKYHGD